MAAEGVDKVDAGAGFASRFDGGASDSFGKAVALGGPQGAFQAFVGAEGWDTTVGGFPYTNCGAAYAFTGVSRAARDPLEYDLDGNLVNDGVMSYVYDAENRLIELTPLHPEEGHLQLKFSYDYMGRRVRKATYTCTVPEPGTPGEPSWSETPSEDLRFIYDGWNVVMERKFDGTSESVVRTYAWGADLSGLNGAAASGNAASAVSGAGGIGGLLAMETTETGEVEEVGAYPKLLYFYDGNGNVGQLVTFDAGQTAVEPPTPIPGFTPGQIAARYEYDPYGGTLVASDELGLDNPFRFSTKYYDDQPSIAAAGERGLYYYGYRNYSPRTGRWVSRDPIGESAGNNLYAFVRNSPTASTDSIGLSETKGPEGEPQKQEPNKCDEDKVCGPDISDAITELIQDIDNQFGALSAGQQKDLCDGYIDAAHWDSDLFRQPTQFTSKNCPKNCPFDNKTPGVKGGQAVTVNGKCYASYDVNYIVYGRMQKLCGSWNRIKAEFWYFLYKNPIEHSLERIEGSSSWTRYGFLGQDGRWIETWTGDRAYLRIPPRATIGCNPCSEKWSGKIGYKVAGKSDGASIGRTLQRN